MSYLKVTKQYIYVSEKENCAVQLAAENFLKDIHSVCGYKAILSKDIHECSVVIGTLDNNEDICKIIKE